MSTRVLHRTPPGATTLLLFASLVQGCAGSARASDDPADDRARREAVRGTVAKPLPERVSEPPAPVTGEAPVDLVARVREDVIRRTGAVPSAVKLVRDESVTWNDGSLGCPRPGEVYIQVAVPGFWIVFDVAGRRVRSLVDGPLPAGRHEVAWDGRDQAGRAVASGTYFSRLCAGGRILTGKMLLAK